MRWEPEEESQYNQGSHLHRGLTVRVLLEALRNVSPWGGEKRRSIYPTVHIPSGRWLLHRMLATLDFLVSAQWVVGYSSQSLHQRSHGWQVRKGTQRVLQHEAG